MVKEKENTEMENVDNSVPLTDEKSDKLLLLALKKANEDKKIPIILWEKQDEGKEFLFEIISRNENIVNAYTVDSRGRKKEVQFQMKPGALNKQLEKFKIDKGMIFIIKYLGLKPTIIDGQETDIKFKSFVVKKYEPETDIFITTKGL